MPTVIDSHRVYSGYLTVDRVQFGLSDGTTVMREVECHGNAVAGLPYDPVRRCALTVRLFRAPAFTAAGIDEMEEACAGMIDGTETAESAMRREAHEELGLEARSVEYIARVWSSPGVSTEQVSLFLIPYGIADRVGAGGGNVAEREDITVLERPLAALFAAAEDGTITDAKLLTLTFGLMRKLAAADAHRRG